MQNHDHAECQEGGLERVLFRGLPANHKALVRRAKEALENSFSQDFSVGAAVLTREGKIHTGSNVEISAESGSLCAERSALDRANAMGDGDQCVAIAFVTRNSDGSDTAETSVSCGVCQQWLADFAIRSGIRDEEFWVISATTDFSKVEAGSLAQSRRVLYASRRLAG